MPTEPIAAEEEGPGCRGQTGSQCRAMELGDADRAGVQGGTPVARQLWGSTQPCCYWVDSSQRDCQPARVAEGQRLWRDLGEPNGEPTPADIRPHQATTGHSFRS
jgi:hypothetical protein